MSTLSVPYGFPVETTDAQRAYKADPRNGVAFARRVSTRKIRTWRIDWAVAPRGVYELVRELWALVGAVDAMDWTDPDGKTVRVRFAEPPTTSMLSHSHVTMSIALEEVL